MQKLKIGVETVKINLTLPADLRDAFRDAIGDKSISEAVREYMERTVRKAAR